MARKVTNVIVAGIGGQGVLKASDILAAAAFGAGHDVKKSEIHGMSQRNGSVASDVRFGDEVFSPMVPRGEADFLVVPAADQVDVHSHMLRPGGLLITADSVAGKKLHNPKTINVALLGMLSTHLDLPESEWIEAIRDNVPEKALEANLHAFELGRKTKAKP
jgi:indolepyruvate ferredoxin oxidoreductase beta subunit